jgi:hypothetical protein
MNSKNTPVADQQSIEMSSAVAMGAIGLFFTIIGFAAWVWHTYGDAIRVWLGG